MDGDLDSGECNGIIGPISVETGLNYQTLVDFLGSPPLIGLSGNLTNYTNRTSAAMRALLDLAPVREPVLRVSGRTLNAEASESCANCQWNSGDVRCSLRPAANDDDDDDTGCGGGSSDDIRTMNSAV
ncbi:hypothetical protein BJX64DRAFT_292175 [Aspergillus heterothallicus]